MKTHVTILCASVIAAGLVSAASLREGEFTRVINDVKVLPVQDSPFTAKVGDRIEGKTAVSTGVQSRAELKFPDKTLTRIGSNSVFRMDQSSRTVELEKGVILLQVPKQLGGAKVRTAAVTAAVTGTTIMVEFIADDFIKIINGINKIIDGFIKIIVIEGEVDVFLNDDPSSFRTLVAGDMWITKADDKSGLPLPVKIDLERLRKTSKLMDDQQFAPLGNEKYINDALSDQEKKKQDGELLKTAFQIEGRGRQVTLTAGERQHISGTGFGIVDRPPGGQGNNPPGPGGGRPGGGPFGPGGSSPGGPGLPNLPINNPGTTIFDGESGITTNPHANAYNSVAGTFVVMNGTHYFPVQDGPFNTYMYGDPKTYDGIDLFLASQGPWFVFKGDEIFISGNPFIDTTNGPDNVLLGATGDVHFTEFPRFIIPGLFLGSSLTLDDDSVSAFAVTSREGNINVDNFYITGVDQNVALYAKGPESDVNIIGAYSYPEDFGSVVDSAPPEGSYSLASISVPDGNIDIYAGRDIYTSGATIEGRNVKMFAERNVSIGGAYSGSSTVAAKESIRIQAQQSVTVTNSSQLRRLSETDNLQVFLDAVNGNVEVLDYSNIEADTVNMVSQLGDVRIFDSSIAAREIKARVMDTGGTLHISNSFFGNGAGPSQLIRLYGEGAGGVLFSGDTTLNGNVVDIAGKSVTIESGGRVRLSNAAGTRVFTDAPNFNNGSNGDFTDLGGATQVSPGKLPYANRPGF